MNPSKICGHKTTLLLTTHLAADASEPTGIARKGAWDQAGGCSVRHVQRYRPSGLDDTDDPQDDRAVAGGVSEPCSKPGCLSNPTATGRIVQRRGGQPVRI